MTSEIRGAPKGFNRRSALGLAAGAGGLIAMAQDPARAASASPGNRSAPQPISTPGSAVALTRYGKVRGYVRGGIYTFKGIPYGADTGGANRWLPPKAPSSWSGTRSALTYGPVCPHPVRGDWGKDEAQFIYDWDDGYPGEDMLRVNVWTQHLDPQAKAPVMVWIHGGGYSSGSSQELPFYDGENLARRGVVLVSLNHRLNALGFMDISQIGGPAYRDSANVGLLDLAFALEWVRDNIAAFGGDPSRVTIFGQSGGGSKVTSLMAMPSAKGLFHRAVVQSGGGGLMPDSGKSQAYAAAVMSELGLAANDIAGLQKMDHARLLSAGAAAAAKINGPGGFGFGGPPPRVARVGFSPTFDGRIIAEMPFVTAAPTISKDVPLIIGNVREEAFDVGQPTTDEQWRERLRKTYGDSKGDAVMAAVKAAFPGETATKLTLTSTGLNVRNSMLNMANLKAAQAAQGGAPAYSYWFTWQPVTVLEGRSGAFHCLDIAFCFDNTRRAEQATGDTPAARSLATKMSQAWINFAATGNPGQPGLAWTPYDPRQVNTMVFDNAPGMRNDPAGPARRALQA